MEDMFQLSALGDIISPDAQQQEDNQQQPIVTDNTEDTTVLEQEQSVHNTEEIQVDPQQEVNEEHVYTEPGDGNFINALNPFAKFLEEQGFISLKDDEGKDITFKDFNELAANMKTAVDRARYEGLNDAQKRYVEALEHGIPLNEVETLEREFATYKDVTEDVLKGDDQLRFNLIYQDLIEKGLGEDKASMFGNAIMKDPAKSLLEAQTYVENKKKAILKNYSDLKNKTEESNKVNLESINKVIKDKKDVLGIEFNTEFKDKVIKSMTTSSGHNASGQPVNAFDKWRADNGADAEVILHALMIYTNNFTNLNKIESKVKSNAVSELNKVLKGQAAPTYREDDNQRGINIDGKVIRLL